jgi:2-haloacid dehalogenase
VIRALVFDVFGTVVDWRSSVIAEGEAIASDVDWPAFADEWRLDGYIRPIARINAGEEPWVSVDQMMRHHLDVLAPRYGLALSSAQADSLAGVWRRLRPWPDAVAGLTALKQRFVISPLSNGGFGLLTEMAKHAGLPWDCVISTALFDAYKPKPVTYQGAARLLDLPIGEVMLVAAHVSDLRAAMATGMRTAYVPRPQEWGPDSPPADPSDPGFDVVADDFLDLSAKLD